MDLTVRKMKRSDLQTLHELLSDSKVMQYLETPFSMEQTQLFLEENGLTNVPRVYAVDDRRGIFVGYVIYHEYDAESVEIGWVLKPEFWGCGYASDLTRELIARAAKENKAVVIECVSGQTATKAIAEKYGFECTGESEGLLIYRLKTGKDY